MTHASHYTRAGEFYWQDYRLHIITNLGDGSPPFHLAGITSFPGVVALGEALAEYGEARYGTFRDGELRTWRSDYIPAGLLTDLEDNTPMENVDNVDGTATFIDNIQGFTPAMYFDVLHPAIRNILSFRDALGNAHLSSTPNTLLDYNNFVDNYDEFN